MNTKCHVITVGMLFRWLRLDSVVCTRATLSVGSVK